ncbi:hypothetical protein ACIRP0_03320 [Streptomyces sp. NPDC101733]
MTHPRIAARSESAGQAHPLEPSQELLDRARAGWERFLASLEEHGDD